MASLVQRRRLLRDASGNLWIGFYTSGLARYRAGRFTFFNVSDGVPAGLVRGLYLDSAGRLWWRPAKAAQRAWMTRQPSAPRFITYTTANGLLSNLTTCVTEDQWGRIYIGTGRGLDRLIRQPANQGLHNCRRTGEQLRQCGLPRPRLARCGSARSRAVETASEADRPAPPPPS